MRPLDGGRSRRGALGRAALAGLIGRAALAALTALLALAAAPAAPGGAAAGASPTAAATGSATVAALAAEYWEHQRAEDLGTRLQLGLPIERLPDLSEPGVAREAAWARAFGERLARLAQTDETGLGHQDWLTLALLRDETDGVGKLAEAQEYLFEITPYDAPFRAVHPAFTGFTFTKDADLARYLRLLRAYAAMVEQVRAHLEALSGRGVLLPRPEIDVAAAMVRAYARPPRESLFEVADGRLKSFNAPQAAGFQESVRRAVATEVNPALERLAGELTGGYRQRAPEAIGLGQYPGGAAAYRTLIQLQTGFDLAPEEIHRRGQAEVERLVARMAEVRRQLGAAGTQREFNQRLRTDPRFLARTPDEVAERLMAAVRRIEPKVSAWFLRQPKAPYGVERLPVALGGMTFGYYQPPEPGQPRGSYLYNASDLDQRPLVGAAALIYHELVPGHHFQLALQAENQDLPPFRRYLTHTSFVEGWGEYASHLGEEMGLYDDPYSLYGRLAMDLFLSNRLVVDTGLNALGWSRQQATEFMRDRLLESDAQIDSEILRYAIALPAQALAYKLGATQIEDLRRHAREALGARFDIRRFHDAVLGSGSLPPRILARHIDWWIEEERRRS